MLSAFSKGFSQSRLSVKNKKSRICIGSLGYHKCICITSIDHCRHLIRQLYAYSQQKNTFIIMHRINSSHQLRYKQLNIYNTKRHSTTVAGILTKWKTDLHQVALARTKENFAVHHYSLKVNENSHCSSTNGNQLEQNVI